MHKIHNPPTVAGPFGVYSHGIEVPPNARWLFISGQVGSGPDGSVPDDVSTQADNVWRNLINVLAAADMDITNVVKVTMFLVSGTDVALVRMARDRVIGSWRPASTLLYVPSLADPKWKVEIEACAAKV